MCAAARSTRYATFVCSTVEPVFLNFFCFNFNFNVVNYSILTVVLRNNCRWFFYILNSRFLIEIKKKLFKKINYIETIIDIIKRADTVVK